MRDEAGNSLCNLPGQVPDRVIVEALPTGQIAPVEGRTSGSGTFNFRMPQMPGGEPALAAVPQSLRVHLMRIRRASGCYQVRIKHSSVFFGPLSSIAQHLCDAAKACLQPRSQFLTAFRSQAMFFPRFFMVRMPSSSRSTSPISRPTPIFQYVEPGITISLIRK